MAPLRFSVPNAEDFDPRIWETAYITGIEGIPWQCEHSVVGNQFNIGRQIDESGKLNIVWPTRSYGNLCLNTTSLRISDSEYSLPIEIARGTVHRLKTQAAEWQRFGMRLPEQFFPLAELALEKFLTALTTPADQARRVCDAQQSIDLALQASISLCDAFSTQALDARRNNEGRLATLLGCQLDPGIEVDKLGDALRTAFNLSCISADLGTVESKTGGRDFTQIDRQLEWACSESSKVCLGPLVDFRDERLPQWLFLLNEGFESVMQLACDYAQKTVERYRGRVHLWNCAAGINVPNQFGWTDEQILRMSVSLIETVRRCDERSPVLLSIDQPWAEYLRKDADGISPLHFADALIRADLGLSGLALELNFDQWPGGSFPRDPIEVNQLVDRWSMLGLPLMVIISAPTARESGSVDQGSQSSPDLPCPSKRIADWKTPDPLSVCEDHLPKSSHIHPHIPAETIVKLLLSKPSVHAVIWNTVNDSSLRNHNHSGLWDLSGQAKPILSELARLRQSSLH